MDHAVIVDAVRTPACKRAGSLSGWHPAELAAEMLTALQSRTGIDPAVVDDVIMGCVTQVGPQSTNVARTAVLAAGWPTSVPGTTVDRQCGSSQQAIHFAAQSIMSGVNDVVVAAGIECMSTVPMFSNAPDGDIRAVYGDVVQERFGDQDSYGLRGLVPQGISAELDLRPLAAHPGRARRVLAAEPPARRGRARLRAVRLADRSGPGAPP